MYTEEPTKKGLKQREKEEQRFVENWTWEEILDGAGPWTQPGEYRLSKEEIEAAKAEQRYYEEKYRGDRTLPWRQLLAFAKLEWASSQDVLSQLYVPDLQCVSTAQCILCLLPALALRCVSPAQYHQFRHHAPGLQCTSRVQSFRQQYPVQSFRRQYPVQSFRVQYPVQSFRRRYPVQSFLRQYPVQSFRQQYPVQSFRRRPGAPAKVPSPGAPAKVPSPGAPAKVPSPGSPAKVPSSGSPATVPSPGSPVTVPSPWSPATVPSPGSPAMSHGSALQRRREQCKDGGRRPEPEPPPREVEEVKEEMVNIVKKKVVKRVIESVSQVGIKSEVREVEPVVKMDTRFFGELLAEVYRKNCDIHTCISEHVAKIRGRKHLLDPSNDYKVEREDIEALIPKGASELTKQQLRYLLQTRMTADKTMRLLLTTFSSLREELIHMSEDLRRLESEKESLERDLSFKADQAEQYDRLLEAIRENNRQLQISLKETSSSQRTLETQLLSSRTTDSNRDFRIKELEGSYRALEKENEMLKQKLAGQCSSSTIQMNTEELSRQYSEQLAALRQEKDKELQSLRTQLTRITTEYTTERSGDKSLHLRITQLLTTLEQREVVIKRQEEEIWRLQQEKKRDSSKNVTTTTITKRYRNQYPLLGLLTDDYNSTSPVKDTKTIVIESRTGEMIKQE
ncbi:golgin subfamily A member 5-like [Salvelinus alpinus]|uniref:golgin subfamily A member 5-like n=1 Tax=Salvelinus alpinus TaxID=8036 RepID=UPI0039FD2D00